MKIQGCRPVVVYVDHGGVWSTKVQSLQQAAVYGSGIHYKTRSCLRERFAGPRQFVAAVGDSCALAFNVDGVCLHGVLWVL